MKTKSFKPTSQKLAQAIGLCVLALAANQAHATDYSFSEGIINGPYAHAGAYAINNLGQVAGTRQDASGLDVYYPIRWDG